MHTHTLGSLQHHHVLLGHRHDDNERRTWLVVVLAAVMNGRRDHRWDDLRFGCAAGGRLAHVQACRRPGHRHPRLPLGTATTPMTSASGSELGEPSGYSIAIILAMIALLIAYESALRLRNPARRITWIKHS